MLLFAMPWVREVVVFIPIMLVYGLGRAVVVVATSAGLAEEVDHTRVSRGAAIATYSTSSDFASVGAPFVGGVVASPFTVAGLFPLAAVACLASFVAGDLAVDRWRGRRQARGRPRVPLPRPRRPADSASGRSHRLG